MARFTPQLLDNIRDRLTLSDIVGRRVSYDKRKSQPQKGDFWACCPFHNEKTPSFHVDDRKGRYHCFGCGVSGDHFRFLTEKDGLSFPEAVEQLADEAGVEMPKSDPRQVEQEKKRASLYDVMALAQHYFLDKLQGKEGAAARGYLQKRGLSLETQRRFGIGFAPRDRSGLKQYLADKGIPPEQMLEAGLIVAGPDIPVSYDKFRDRIMFPILDLKERVIAYGGRAMSADNPAKYMNSPETPLFSKRSILYNVANARRRAYEKGRVIVVEGYMDVIALAQAGIDEVVAPLGTALTEDQLRILWKMADEPILCFDGDEAGLRALNRSVDVALPQLKPGKTIQFTLLPEGQDPDDLVKIDGVDAMEDLLSSARSLFDMIWARETENMAFNTPERKAALEATFSSLARTISDASVRRYYEQAFRERLQAFFVSADDGRGQAYDRGGRRNSRQGGGYQTGFGGTFTFNEGRRRTGRYDSSVAPLGSQVSEKLRKTALTSRNYGQSNTPLIAREMVLVITLLNHPSLLSDHLEDFAELTFKNPSIKRIQTALIDCWSEDESCGAEDIRKKMVGRGLEEDILRLENALSDLPFWQIDVNAPDSVAETGWKQALALHHRAHTLNKELRAAERAYADDESELNLERLLDVNAQIVNVDGTDILIDNLDAHSAV